MSVKVKLMWCPAGGKVKRQCSHNHWVGKIASVLVALWVSHDRSWVSLSVFIFVMWERSPGWRHLVSQSSGQAIPFKLGSSITLRVLSWFPRPLVVEQDDQLDQSLTTHFTVGNNVNAACADLTYLKNGWRSSQQLLHRWEMLPWPRPFQVVFVFSALILRGPAGSLRAEVSVTRVTDDKKYQRVSERALGSSGPMCGLEVFIGNSGSSPLRSVTFDQML